MTTSASSPVPPNSPPPLRILLQDESMIAVDKPGGIPVHGSGFGETTIETLLRDQLGQKSVRQGFTVSAVHRLDRQTSGVLLFARRKRACRRLMEQFADGQVRKTYLALVQGRLGTESGSITTSLPGLGKHQGKVQDAHTDWRLIAQGADAALVECSPRTGRTHQIRRHMRSIGHPLAGDDKYGTARFNEWAKKTWALPRMFLHASGLALSHPDDGTRLTFAAPLPEELLAVLERAEIPNAKS